MPDAFLFCYKEAMVLVFRFQWHAFMIQRKNSTDIYGITNHPTAILQIGMELMV